MTLASVPSLGVPQPLLLMSKTCDPGLAGTFHRLTLKRVSSPRPDSSDNMAPVYSLVSTSASTFVICSSAWEQPGSRSTDACHRCPFCLGVTKLESCLHYLPLRFRGGSFDHSVLCGLLSSTLTHCLSMSTYQTFVSQYPSSRQNTPRTMGNDRAQLPSNLRPKASQTSTAMRIPTVQIERASPDLKGAFQEPLVEDFQDRYTSRPYQASEEKQVVATTAAEPEHYTSPDVSDIDDSSAPAPPNITVRGPKVPIPTRKRHEDDEYHSQLRSVPDSSNARPERRGVRAQSSNDEIWSVPTTPDTHVYRRGDRSSGDSIMSQETTATAASIHTLPALQTKGAQEEYERLEPLMEDDPRSFDLVAAPQEQATGVYAMEKRAELLLSSEHLRTIFEDPKLLLKFTGFLNSHRPSSIPILIYYLDALKAIRAIQYANAIAEALEPIQDFGFTETSAPATKNSALQAKADQAFEILVRDDLPAYIAHTWIQVVSVSIQRRITGTLAPHLREASEGLAEVFCLTDPSRSDNPIVFASEEFARTTQYGMSYSIGRNCRFLQGPRTNPNSGRRLAEACVAGKEQTEVFVNYRRDGSPFMNLLMIAPLMDSRGNVRYFIGAQVDVSGLIKDCAELDGLARLVDREQDPEGAAEDDSYNRKDEFQDLSEMFNGAELETVRKYGGRMHREHADDSDRESISSSRPRLLLKDPSQEILDRQIGQIPSSVNLSNGKDPNGRLQGVYQHVGYPGYRDYERTS